MGRGFVACRAHGRRRYPLNFNWLRKHSFLVSVIARRPSAKTKSQSLTDSSLKSPIFLLFLTSAGLIQGSHAAFYAFSTIHWRAAGLSESTIGLLWAEGVAAEVLLFLFSGAVVHRIGITRLLVIGASAAVIRWTTMALTTDFAVLAMTQPLHALTFGATHLASLHFIQRAAPTGSSTTAQALYSAFGLGIASAFMMIASGHLYERYDDAAFFAMTFAAAIGGLCAFALRRYWNGGQLGTNQTN